MVIMAKTAYNAIKQVNRPFVITAPLPGSKSIRPVDRRLSASGSTDGNTNMQSRFSVAFCRGDIGGFSSHATKELLIRWVQAACFFPLFRNHAAAGTRRQEPWTFDAETLSIYRRIVRMRYRFIPYLYDLFWEHEITGAPVIRPLVYHYPDDPETYNIEDEYMVGERVLVTPVV